MASTSTSTSSRKLILKSSNGEKFKVDENVAMQSQTIKHMIEDLDDINSPIPVSIVTGTILSKVIEYCKKHATEDLDSDEQLKQWDKEYANNMDLNTLYYLLLAANYMEIKGLLELITQCVADMIKENRRRRLGLILTSRMILLLKKKRTFEMKTRGHSKIID